MRRTTLRLTTIAMVAFTIACTRGLGTPGDGGTTSGDGSAALPATCDSGCPTGYKCTGGVCTGGSSQALSLALRTVSLTGTIKIDGQPPAPQAGCSGDHVQLSFLSGPLRHSFWDPVIGSSINAQVLCATMDGSFSARVAPGTYRVLAARSDTHTTFSEGSYVVQSSVKVDWSRPTWTRIKQRLWNAEDHRLFTPKVYGWGFDINFYEAARRLGLKH